MTELIHLYGPISLQGYGVAIFVGLIISVWCATNHIWCRQHIGAAALFDLISWAVAAGIIGGRLLYVITEWHEFHSLQDMFAFWDGGFSLLGTVIAELCFLPWYSWKYHIPYFPTIDLCALYAPLLQSISRLGCFWAGCCGGIASNVPWALFDQEVGYYVHPTQLYSAAALAGIFIFIRFFITRYFKRSGQVIAWYLICIGIERALIDLWRTDHYGCIFKGIISAYQALALSVSLAGLFMLLLFTLRDTATSYEHI